MTVTAEMYRSRVADVLNLTTDNDRLRSELQRITDIAKASTTANSLPNIAKIASDALAGASVPAPQPPVEGLREALEIISGLSVSLRAGGPDYMDLQELSDALERACEVADTALASLASPSLTAGEQSGEAAMREALTFYADPFAWKAKHDPDDVVRIPDFYSETSFGDKAADALAPATLIEQSDSEKT